MLGSQGWSCPRVSYHAFERRFASFFYDISSWCIMIILHAPGLSGRSSKQSSLGYSSTAVEGYKRCSTVVSRSSPQALPGSNKGVDRIEQTIRNMFPLPNIPQNNMEHLVQRFKKLLQRITVQASATREKYSQVKSLSEIRVGCRGYWPCNAGYLASCRISWWVK